MLKYQKGNRLWVMLQENRRKKILREQRKPTQFSSPCNDNIFNKDLTAYIQFFYIQIHNAVRLLLSFMGIKKYNTYQIDLLGLKQYCVRQYRTTDQELRMMWDDSFIILLSNFIPSSSQGQWRLNWIKVILAVSELHRYYFNTTIWRTWSTWREKSQI